MTQNREQLPIETLLSHLNHIEPAIDLKHQQALRRALLNSSCAPDGTVKICVSKVVSWTTSLVVGGVSVVVCVMVVRMLSVDVSTQKTVVSSGEVSTPTVAEVFVANEPVYVAELPITPKESTIENSAVFASSNTYLKPTVDHVKLLMQPVADLAVVR